MLQKLIRVSFKHNHIITIVCILLGITNVNSQDLLPYNNYFYQLKLHNFNEAIESAHAFAPKHTDQLQTLAQLLSFNNQLNKESIDAKIKNLNVHFNDKDPFVRSLSYLIIGHYNLAESASRPKAFSDFNHAYQNAKQTKYKPLIKETLLAIIKLYRIGLLQNDISFENYLEAYYNLCEDDIDFFKYYNNQFNLFSQTQIYGDNSQKNKTLFTNIIHKLDSLKPKISSHNVYLIDYYIDKGNYTFNNNGTNAKYYFQKGIDLCDTTLYFKPYKFSLFLHLARVENQEGNIEKALDYVKNASKFKSNSNQTKDDFYISGYKADFYAKLKKYDSAYYFLRTSRYLEFELEFQKQDSQISKLEVELGTTEKEKQILIEQRQKKKISTIAFALAGLFLFSSITFVLVQKNTKRKQLLVVQEKALETQKLATVLKEQELTTIDAMIEGQEKERQRIANDLHDDLGGLMTTVKWQFNAFQEKQTPELFEKTNALLEEAYQKIRGIAHAKNAGVMAKQGLLKAVQNVADKVSASNKINIDVVDFGLETRLENSLELMLFRIIQELITNIIKHADAKNVTINLTNHEDSINIMVEDDGVGFNPSQITTLNKGMGISSIDKRVEHLNGKMTIESEPNKGTTIIIDIPM